MFNISVDFIFLIIIIIFLICFSINYSYETFQDFVSLHTPVNDSWIGYTGDKHNYLRGGTVVNGGFIGEGGDFAKAVQIGADGTVTAEGSFHTNINDSWIGYTGDKHNYLRGGTVIAGGLIGEGGDFANAVQIGKDGTIGSLTGVRGLINDSWLGYSGDKHNYLRGGTVIAGGLIGEGGDFANAVQIGADGSISSPTIDAINARLNKLEGR
jgi:hypothetical protein